MTIEGGCYCGELRYQAEGDPALKGQCFCRECQYISGGDSALLLGMPEAGFSYTKGTASAFQRSDLEAPVTREFCPNCGTHVASKAPASRTPASHSPSPSSRSCPSWMPWPDGRGRARAPWGSRP